MRYILKYFLTFHLIYLAPYGLSMCTMHTTHMLGALQKKYTNSTLKNRVCTHSRATYYVGSSWCGSTAP